MIYKPKTLFTGYKLGLKTPDMYVGVPSKYLDKNGKIRVLYMEELRTFYPHQIVESREFPDKFSDGTYTLNYYLWKKR